PWVKWLLIVPIGVLAILETVSAVAAAEGLRAGGAAIAVLNSAGRLPFYLTIPAVSSFFTALGIKSGAASTADARRRLSLVYWGAVVGLTPGFLLLIATIVTGRGDSVAPDWLLVAALVSLLAFPLSLAYAIVVQRALDVRVVVRLGLQYALAWRGVMVLQAL